MSIPRLKLLCALLAFPCSITLAASFDCTKAGTQAEKAICASPSLGHLDQDIALAYKTLLKSLDAVDAQQLRDEQRDWIKSRDASVALDASLRARLSALRNALALLPTPTDDAFDALLSMPSAKPAEGEWEVIAPDDFAPDNEAALIRYLALQVKRGANVNEYRHNGTLLLHAIRAGLDATSLWLLAHGADPAKRVQGEDSDALIVALEYGRWNVFSALLKSPRYARMAPRELAETIWPTALDSPDAVKYLLAHKVPVPDGMAGQCMLESALTRLDFNLVQALPERTPLRVAPQKWDAKKGAMVKLQYKCTNRDNGDPYWVPQISSIKLASLSSTTLEAADARISTPILPYLLPAIVTAEDARRLFQLKLRRPFEQPAFTRRILKTALQLPYAPGVSRALLQPIPPDVLRSALDNDAMLELWFRRFRGESQDDFAWALDVPSATALNTHVTAVLKGMSGQDYSVVAAAVAKLWPVLLPRLRGTLPLRAKGDGMPELMQEAMPVSSWSQLFKLGYRPTERELDSALQRITLSELRLAWPALVAALPALPERVVERMLAPYLPGQCSASVSQADVDKVKFLLTQGVRAQKHLALCTRAKQDAEQPYAELLATGVVFGASDARLSDSAASTPVKLVAEHKLGCRIEINDAVRSALAGGEIGTGERVKIDSVQAIDFPGDPRCALIVSGTSMSRLDFDDEQSGSFNAGPTPEPHPSCADPAIIKEVWLLRDSKIDVGTFDVGFYTNIEAIARDAASERRYFVATEYHGKCGQDKNYLAAWVNQGGHLSLKALEPDAPAARAYERQCAQATDGTDCFGESTAGGGDADAPAWSDQSLASFVDAHFAAQRKDFVKAVIAMDQVQLQAELKAGIFASWRTAAMAEVAASKLEPQEKRRRMAWLLDSPERVIDIMQAERMADKDSNPAGLIAAWLPEPAWDALMPKISAHSSLLGPLRAAATTQGQYALACRLAKAYERSCRPAPKEPQPPQ